MSKNISVKIETKAKKKTFEELRKSGVDEKEAKMLTTVFFVKANSFEVFELWRKHKDETNWEEDNHGFVQVVGEIGEGMPVNVSFTFAKIHGKRICFYETISRYVDKTMVDKFIKDNYPVYYDGGYRIAMTDAHGFYNVINACREEKRSGKMEVFKRKVESADDDRKYNFECYPNTEPIEIGDYFLFFFAGIADVGKCWGEENKREVNEGLEPRKDVIDLTSGFWANCYKIKETDFDLSLV